MTVAAPGTQKMDRGSDALKTHVSGAKSMSIRQTRKGWFQECLGCEVQDEFKFVKEGEKEHFATALEKSNFCVRCLCSPCHPFKLSVVENGTNAEMLTVDRPHKCCVTCCKCCSYQEATITSGGETMGTIKEQSYCCVPRFKTYDAEGNELYKIHAPTCMGGLCVDCCAEGNPCGKGCCRSSFRVYPATQKKTDGDAEYLGVILKKPKSKTTEVLTSANAFDVSFPESASVDEKALLLGSAMFFNANFFEEK